MGIKQGEYLKVRLKKTEETLENADKLISSLQEAKKTSEEIVKGKDYIINMNKMVYDKDIEIKNIEITRLNSTIEINNSIYKKQGRKKMWNGVKYGTVGGVILTLAAVLIIK